MPRYLISESEELKKFSKFFELNEQYLIQAFARKKYGSQSAQECLNRTVYKHSDEENYLYKNLLMIQNNIDLFGPNSEIAPDSSLVFYITLNPRDMTKTVQELQKEINFQLFNSIGKNADYFKNQASLIHQKTKSFMHKNPQKRYTVVDIDSLDIVSEFFTYLLTFEIEPLLVIKTRGGYHVVFSLEQFIYKSFGQWLHKDFGKRTMTKKSVDGQEITVNKIDILKDPMIPIPGTLQGGTCVKIVEEWKSLIQ